MFASLALASAGFASNMVAPTRSHSAVTAIRMEEAATPPPPPPPAPTQSKALPFMKAPAMLDGSMVRARTLTRGSGPRPARNNATYFSVTHQPFTPCVSSHVPGR